MRLNRKSYELYSPLSDFSCDSYRLSHRLESNRMIRTVNRAILTILGFRPQLIMGKMVKLSILLFIQCSLVLLGKMKAPLDQLQLSAELSMPLLCCSSAKWNYHIHINPIKNLIRMIQAREVLIVKYKPDDFQRLSRWISENCCTARTSAGICLGSGCSNVLLLFGLLPSLGCGPFCHMISSILVLPGAE